MIFSHTKTKVDKKEFLSNSESRFFDENNNYRMATRPQRMEKFEFWKTSGKPGKVVEFWKNDFKFWSCFYFKLLIIILEYSDAIKKQKEEEKENGKENLRKRQILDKMQELKEKENSIEKSKRNLKASKKKFMNW